MSAAVAAPAAPAARPGYDPDAAATARRVLPMLAGEPVVWLSTIRPDGTPHLVPTWFWWDGEALLFWSKPDAAKVRNLRANPRLMVAVGDAGADFSVGLFEATAELVERPVPAGFFAKYADELGAGRLDREAFRGLYIQGVRVVPTRFLAWHGRGARHGARRPGSARTGRAGLAERLAGRLERASARLHDAVSGMVRPATA